jgi:peptide/nickel transport system substrate-binding protein
MNRAPIRRRAVPVALAALTVLALVAAAAYASPGATKQTAASGTLVVDTSFVVQTIDPQRMFEPTSQIAVKGMYDTLLTFRGGSTQPLPWLARSWKVSKDAKTITFNLRRDARFSDGSRLTSADVLFSFRRVINLKGSPSFLLAGVKVSAPNAYTVVLRSSTPNPALLRIVPNPSLGIVNSRLVKANGGTDAVGADKKDKAEPFLLRTSAGSGPYVLKSYSNKTQIILEANPRFWGPKPKFQTVVLRNMPAATQLLNVQRGQNEVALDLSAQQATTLRGRSGVRVVTNASANLFNIDINTDPKIAPVASNKNIQTAIRYALDYPGFVKLSGPGAVQAPGMIPTTFIGHLPPSARIKRNLARARSEVAKSGIDNPKITMTYPSELTINGISFATLAQKTKANLAEVGIEVTLVGKPVNAFLETYAAGKHEMSQSYWGPDYPDPNDYLVFTPGGLAANRVNWGASDDPQLAALAKKAQRTVSDTQRAALFRQIGRIMNQRAPFYPLFQPAQAIVSSSNLTNATLGVIWPLDVRAVGSRYPIRDRARPPAQAGPLAVPPLSGAASHRPRRSRAGDHVDRVRPDAARAR